MPKIRRGSLLASALLMCLASLPLAARAETVDEKPRVVVLLPAGGQNDFGAVLRRKLTESRRVEVVEKPNLKALLAAKKIVLGAKLSVQQSLQAQALSGADVVLDGTQVNKDGNLRVTSRLYDLRTGELSRDLSLIGASTEAPTLASQLAGFVRHSLPLRCLIKDVADGRVVIDLGAADGVTAGSSFRVFRHMGNVQPREIGLVKVGETSPFASVAEVTSMAKGFGLQAGDTLIEQTSGLLLQKP